MDDISHAKCRIGEIIQKYKGNITEILNSKEAHTDDMVFSDGGNNIIISFFAEDKEIEYKAFYPINKLDYFDMLYLDVIINTD